MVRHLLQFGVLLTLSKLTLQASTVDSPSYIGAVVEYHPVTNGDDSRIVAEMNSNNYRMIIKIAASYHPDIIVFPEFGLTSLPKDGDREMQFNASEYRAYYQDIASYIPSPNELVVLCDIGSEYSKSLQSISCAAREFNMYVAVNHHEKVKCNPSEQACAPDGFLLYNTNVVFDRAGRVIARYRKYNLYSEAGINVTTQPEISTFHTDFGVTFGQFICADLVHQRPATYFADNPNVTDVIFTAHWFDSPPFFETTQTQAAWSYAADVNFLASEYSDALTASGGIGIYAGKSGPIKVHRTLETSNALIVAEIPKLNRRKRVMDVRAGKSLVHVFTEVEVPTISGTPERARNASDFSKLSLQSYTTALLDPGQSSHIMTLCDRGLCCDFHVEMSYDKELAAKPGAKQYKYRLVVFNGVDDWGPGSPSGGLEVCALVSCAGDSIDDCGRFYPEELDVITPLSLDKLIITRRADLGNEVFYAPTTLQLQTRVPLNGTDFLYLTSGGRHSCLLLMHLAMPRSDIATFGIYGRRFDRDGQPPSRPVDGACTAFKPNDDDCS